MLEKPVDVTPIAAKDPVLKTDSTVPQSADPSIKTQPRKMAVDQNDLSTVENTTINKTPKQTDLEIETLNTQLETLKSKKEQQNFKFEDEQAEVKKANEEADELDVNDKEVDSIIKDTVNCVNGR